MTNNTEKKIYKATLHFTVGFGDERKSVVAENYKELVEKADALIEHWSNFTFKMPLCEPTKPYLFSITYFYPSGKKFYKDLRK